MFEATNRNKEGLRARAAAGKLHRLPLLRSEPFILRPPPAPVVRVSRLTRVLSYPPAASSVGGGPPSALWRSQKWNEDLSFYLASPPTATGLGQTAGQGPRQANSACHGPVQRCPIRRLIRPCPGPPPTPGLRPLHNALCTRPELAALATCCGRQIIPSQRPCPSAPLERGLPRRLAPPLPHTRRTLRARLA